MLCIRPIIIPYLFTLWKGWEEPDGGQVGRPLLVLTRQICNWAAHEWNTVRYAIRSDIVRVVIPN